MVQHRYEVLAISSFILFTFYYVYDIPAALNKKLVKEAYAQKITILYSIYALPNMILPLFIGFSTFVHMSYMAIVLCALVFLGNMIFSVGVYFDMFSLMLVGRFVYGVGGESFSVIQNMIIAKEFEGKELAFSMSLSSAMARCGTVFNYLLTPHIAENFSVFSSCFLGCCLTLLGLGACFVLIQKQNAKEVKERYIGNFLPQNRSSAYTTINSTPRLIFAKAKSIFVATTNVSERNNPVDKDCVGILTEKSKKQGIGTVIDTRENEMHPNVYSNDVWSEIIDDVKQKKPFHNKDQDGFSNASNLVDTTEHSRNQIGDLKTSMTNHTANTERPGAFSPAFGLLVAISFMFAAAWAPFSSLASILLQKRYSITALYAGRLMAIEEGFSLVFNIFVGSISDIFGFKLIFVAAGSFLQIAAHLLIFQAYGSPIIPILLIGFSGPFISCYWPCITYLVSKDKIAAGFSIFTCVLNIAYTFTPIMVGTLALRDISFDTVEFYMICVCAITFISILMLSLMNCSHKLGLNRKSFTKY